MQRDQKSLFGAISPGSSSLSMRRRRTGEVEVYETAVVSAAAEQFDWKSPFTSIRTALECVTK